MSLYAYFISPEGHIIPVFDEYGRHINAIIAHPDKFGFTQEEIEETYKKHGEHMGTEGNAREELLVKSINNGWARIRKYSDRNASFWSIQVPELNIRYRRYIQDFVERAMNGERPLFSKPMGGKYEEIRISDFKNRTEERVTFMDALSPGFVKAGGSELAKFHYSYNEAKQRYKLKYCLLSEYIPKRKGLK
jgi:hypothetical protein